MEKLLRILIQALPVLIMIVLIPLVQNDYLLSVIFIIIIIISLFIKYEKQEYIFLIFGFLSMIFFETIFIKTNVETFNRNSLFGIMPLWLPILWAYAFLAIKRGIKIIEK